MAFATAAELATFLDTTFGDDTRAELLLDMATQVIRTYTGQMISEDTSVEVFLGGGMGFVLKNFPVTEVVSVEVDGVTEPTTRYTVEPNGVLRWDWGHRGWAYGTEITVEYTHGYDPIPDDIKYVCLSIAGRALENVSGVQAESIGTYSVTYSNSVGGSANTGLLSETEKALLRPYSHLVAA